MVDGLHFNVPGAAIEAPGAVVFCATATFAVLEQPLAVFTTVRLYVPPTVPTGFWLVEVKPAGPFQLKLFPVVVPPVKLTEVFVQFKLPDAEAVAPGGVVFCATVTFAVLVHPFTVFKTVKL